MDIKEFISETLEQITESIESNPSSLNTDNIKPYEAREVKSVATVQGGFITSVEFDMAVTESKSQDGGAKLSIAGVGSLGGDLNAASKTVSRIKFTVPLHIQPE
ncbi:hypothetical protein [Thalassotalea sp. SU-HH00458]|uniref:hypothetical protein n=1 Tax=Thalassotalea sp. SU-HH00458 TaxID=3127657 RepID=UPI003102B5DE